MQTMKQRGVARRVMTALGRAVAATGVLLYAGAVWAATVGEVEFSRGVSMAYMDGQTPRMMGRGLSLNEGDHLSTAAGAIAIIKLQDGTQMTLRPLTEMVIKQFRYTQNVADDTLVIELLQGGFRAITGQIPKHSADAAKVVTANSTLYIRGTDFDARICASDCKAESAQVPQKPRANAVQASAKLVNARGEIAALDANGARRNLSEGASVYPGDTVETGAQASTVLAFHDDGRVTLGGNTRFRVDSYSYDGSNAAQGSSFVSLLKGSMRALTGLIGKERKDKVGYNTPTATIGIRGTGFDSDCPLPSDGNDACSFYTWLGTIAVTPNGQSTPRLLSEGQGLFVSKTEVRPLSAPILQNLQRPDSVKIDLAQLFAVSAMSEDAPGLFVFVRDGNVELSTATATLFLGRGETGYAGVNGEVLRPQFEPLFIEFDAIPLPNSANPLLLSVMNENRIRAADICQ